ncbi:peptidoglycan D,D-transpeptidase FtsI family protein [Ectobacillus ponti]|uniref:serine-type D-Ala-D-Ala carboxypeptidase n=1 Tax=Ectobacillus ponti TaxID=2961894 RepID=A0AA42BRC3_9BACI|nr:penicillin-binding protein 2 [Ectobacillus ponti]MCP8967258.1 penicillin-binding protein 2 [Ectobacillus ponti]
MQTNKRTIVLLCFIMAGLFCLAARLVQIQLVSTEAFGKKNVNLLANSVAQRTHTVVLDDGRGRFVDRNGEALTDDYHPSLILFPFLKNMSWPSEKLAAILHVEESELRRQAADARQPFVFQGTGKALELTVEQMNQINELGVPGIVAAQARIRGDRQIASHFIGIIGQNTAELARRYPEKYGEGKLPDTVPVGISGLQRAFDEFLLTDGEAKLLYHVDRQGEPIFGKRVKYTYPANPFYPVVLQTTLDKALQQQAEKLLEQHGIAKGGLVLLDVGTNEILAMASRPALSMESNAAYQRGAVNYMLQPQFPGSVFKTVIAAAAIDKGLAPANRLFDCNTNPYGEGAGERQLGMLSFADSFAQSCNRTFADLGRELQQQDKGAIEHYAALLGLTGTVGWHGQLFHFADFRQLPEEQEGQIWGEERDKAIPKAIAQTSIGQKNVRFSPLALANMMATIARDGVKLQVKAVREIQYKNGTKLYQFPQQELPGGALSPETVKEVQHLLRGVVSSPKGTGSFYYNLPLSVAGKSGTAETGRAGYVHKWFAGYFPAEAPRYALVVVDLETAAADNPGKLVFADYVKTVAAWEEARDVEPR